MANGLRAASLARLPASAGPTASGRGSATDEAGLDPRATDFSFDDYMLPSPSAPLAAVDGWPINVPSIADAVERIIAAARRAESFSVFTLNLDHLVKLRGCASFRRAYRKARFVTADGEPVARLASRQDARIVRTTGADLVTPLAKAAASHGLPVYLFGTTADALARASAVLDAECRGRLGIAGMASPSLTFDPKGPEADRAIAAIAASGARLCFVALGAPKQEIFATRAAARGVKAGFICVGAGLDFLAGTQTRAPGFMQRSGLEWLWRLATSPRKLSVRYLLCAYVLADITLLSPMRDSIFGPWLAD